MAPLAAFDLPPTSAAEVVQRFLDGTLASEHWTHLAHLLVCRHVLETSETAEVAVDRLRPLIEAHNARVGLRRGHGGYHETVTRYFVGAMAHANPPTIAALLTDPSLRCEAPLDHWSREALATDAARERWLDPDLAPVPWASATGPGWTADRRTAVRGETTCTAPEPTDSVEVTP